MQREETVARAMCAAEGHNPDEPYETGEVEPQLLTTGAGSCGVVMGPVIGAMWQRYLRRARVVIAAHDALTG
jgi:hypothetical protein